MDWHFQGFHNWPESGGTLTILQGLYVLRASLTSSLPRETCERCVCWRVYGTCKQVQVDDLEGDALDRASSEGYSDIPKSECMSAFNCCPILFFDFIGIALPTLAAELSD